MAERQRNTQALGQTGEAIALDYLRRKKYSIVETGFRFLRGEIDIIAQDHGTLVFVEVKMRTSRAFGRPEEAVTPSKQQQIRKVAEGYLLQRGLGNVPCRFDVISIRPSDGGKYAIDHFADAF
jgi:putative endonuclease